MAVHDNSRGPLEPSLTPEGFEVINVNAALERASSLNFVAFLQDIAFRISLLFVIALQYTLSLRTITLLAILFFCAMWYISRLRIKDTILRIEEGFISGAQRTKTTHDDAKWEYFLSVLGSRATSRRDISLMEMALRFEPVAWGIISTLTFVQFY